MKKRFIEKQTRGWLPKDPQIPIKSSSIRGNYASAYRWTATSIVIGSIVGACLGALGSFLGLTDGVGAFLWPIMVGLIIGLSTALVAVIESKRYRYKGAAEND
jgi:hypothetical protein